MSSSSVGQPRLPDPCRTEHGEEPAGPVLDRACERLPQQLELLAAADQR